jgi:hypothetical protein
MSDHSSGLTREIRTATSSEQYDLAGYTESRVKDLIKNTFSTPFENAKSMIRCTLVVGGGKLVRARYDDDLIKWTASALREIGFVEDKSAAETLDSQGTYKTQHDTGQNLKYVIVFPRLNVSADQSAASEKVDSTSPEYIVSACDMSTFQEVIRNKVLSWRQKKRLLKFLQESLDHFKALEAKLISGTILSQEEQTAYDANPGNFEEKIQYLQSEIKKMVDDGIITASEKNELVTSLASTIQSLTTEINNADGPKRRLIEDRRNNIIQRKANIEKVETIQRRLKNSAEIQQLRLRLFPLLALEDKGRSMSLTMSDLKLIEEKSDLEARIFELENSSRGWFEDESDFQAMCEFEVNEAKAKGARKSQQAAKGSAPKSGQARSSSQWSTVASSKPTAKAVSAPKSRNTGFSAAFADDSD